MKPLRPIKTFATWLLEVVYVRMSISEMEAKKPDEWIRQNLGLEKSRDSTYPNVYSVTYDGFPTRNAATHCSYYFPTAEHADKFKRQFGGVRDTKPKRESIRTNMAIAGNFTLADLKHLYGDPLPNVVQLHLVDLQDRLSGYFDEFKYMHQDWSPQTWWPSAFVYVNKQAADEEREILIWLHETLQGNHPDKNHWQRGWTSSASGIYTFDDPGVASLFKLRFGGDPLPEFYHCTRIDTFRALADHTNLVNDKGRIYWNRDPNIPDYTIAKNVLSDAE